MGKCTEYDSSMVLEDGSEPSTVAVPVCQKYIEIFGRLKVSPKLPC
jgi:hypothetical protein